MTSPRLPRALAGLLAAALLLPALARAASADSVRKEVGALASAGRFDDALAVVDRNASELPASWNAMFQGKLALEGGASAQGYKLVANAPRDSAAPQMRSEALYRQGQYQYASGRYHLAIPLFREYLAQNPTGYWSEASSYWMAHACIQHARLRAGRGSYLDTAQAYLRKLEFRGKDGYYWPMARAAQARIHLMRGDTVGALRALRDARSRAPAEERAGVLLLSYLAEKPGSAAAAEWEDSLRWGYPLSPETRALPPARARPVADVPAPSAPPANTATVPTPAPAATGTLPKGYHLQLGVFSSTANAERLRNELAGKKIPARVDPWRSGGKELYRVTTGPFKSAAGAEAEGKRLKALGYDNRVLAP
jgi:cell division septation protein DedD